MESLGLLLFKACSWPANEHVWWHQAVLKGLDDIKSPESLTRYLRKEGRKFDAVCGELLRSSGSPEQWTEFLYLMCTF